MANITITTAVTSTNQTISTYKANNTAKLNSNNAFVNTLQPNNLDYKTYDNGNGFDIVNDKVQESYAYVGDDNKASYVLDTQRSKDLQSGKIDATQGKELNNNPYNLNEVLADNLSIQHIKDGGMDNDYRKSVNLTIDVATAMVPVGGQVMLGVKASKTLLGMSGVASASKQLLQAGKIAVNVGTIPAVAAKGIADVTNNNQYNEPLNNLNTDFSVIDKGLEFAINPSAKTAISIGLDYSKNMAINTFNVVETLNNAVHLPIRTKEENHKNTVNTIEQAVLLPDFASGYPVCKPKDTVICK